MLATAFPIFNRLRPGWVIVCMMLAFTGIASAADAADAVQHADAAAVAGHDAHASHDLPLAAPWLGNVGPFVITSSMVLCWVVAAVLIIFAQIATRTIKDVPTGAQNFWEWMVESLFNFLETIMGRALTLRTFWFFASIFLFILFNNWFGLIPGVGTVGWGTPDEHGAFQHISHPLLRGGNADLNMTLGMACVFFLLWIYWSVTANGPVGFLKHIFVYNGDAVGIMRTLLIFIFFVVGFLEVISILIRPVTLTFRLYGNVFAGETLLEKMFALGGNWGFLAALPFYGLELMVGIIQALVFMLLTAVFTSLMCSHDGHDDHAEHKEGAH
ncbi:MAG TPA: F0F1 ATP synthase subunit A [Chthoniobacterales bacterium]